MSRAERVREIIKEFSKDFIPYHPGGPYGHPVQGVSNVREARGLERCCACICEDIQSGMIYCGDLADVVADVSNMDGCIVAYCSQHKNRMKEHKST